MSARSAVLGKGPRGAASAPGCRPRASFRALPLGLGLALALGLGLGACGAGAGADRNAAGAPLGLGQAAPAQLEAAWNVDVNPSGAGLPAGSGTVAAGAAIFAQRCAVCHGVEGQGQGTFPQLIGREPRAGFPFGRDPRLPRTIGNYWPYATTLYDYVHRAMPLTAPGSLSADETYSVVAYLLARNEIIPGTAVLDARTLPSIRMPARDRFVVDDRRGGREFR